MKVYRFSLFVIFCISSSFCLNLERTEEPKYSVKIYDGRDKSVYDNLVGQEVPMNLKGVSYRCFLPVEETEEEAPVVDFDLIPKPRDFLETLAGTCLYRSTGWWTYELCHGKHIRQYHQERDLPIRPQDDFLLGKQVADNKAEYAITKLTPEDVNTVKDYYAELYDLGTPCDISDLRRQTEVRWYCTPDKTVTTISEIKEPASCTYIINVNTPLICKHPAFAVKKEKQLAVICVPSNPAEVPVLPDLKEPKQVVPPKKVVEEKQQEKQQEKQLQQQEGQQEEVVFYMTMDELLNQLGGDNVELQEHILQQVTEQLQFMKTEEDAQEEEEEEEKKGAL